MLSPAMVFVCLFFVFFGACLHILSKHWHIISAAPLPGVDWTCGGGGGGGSSSKGEQKDVDCRWQLAAVGRMNRSRSFNFN